MTSIPGVTIAHAEPSKSWTPAAASSLEKFCARAAVWNDLKNRNQISGNKRGRTSNRLRNGAMAKGLPSQKRTSGL